MKDKKATNTKAALLRYLENFPDDIEIDVICIHQDETDIWHNTHPLNTTFTGNISHSIEDGTDYIRIGAFIDERKKQKIILNDLN